MQRRNKSESKSRKHPKFNISDPASERKSIQKDYDAICQYKSAAEREGKSITNCILTSEDIPDLHRPVLIGEQGEAVLLYEDKVLGKGGFSTICFGIRMDNRELCAVKIIDLNDQRIKNKEPVKNEFLHEKNMLRKVESLVDTLEVKTDKYPRFYCIQDLIHGESLFEFLDKKTEGQTFSLMDELDMCLSVVESMKKLHDHGILHRDIKTDQVLWDPELSHATITDLGFAIEEDNAKDLREIVGSYVAVAPELWDKVTRIENGYLYTENGCQQNERTEIFGVATILADILMDTSPRENATRFYDEFDSLIKQGDPVSCSKVFRQCYASLFEKDEPDEIRRTALDLTIRMLDKDPNNRPTFEEVMSTLKMCKDELINRQQNEMQNTDHRPKFNK